MVTPAHRSVAAASTTAAPGIFNPASGITCTSSAEELPSGPLDVARTAARTGPGEPVLPVDGGSARDLRAVAVSINLDATAHRPHATAHRPNACAQAPWKR